jgi:hypothetical protein
VFKGAPAGLHLKPQRRRASRQHQRLRSWIELYNNSLDNQTAVGYVICAETAS